MRIPLLQQQSQLYSKDFCACSFVVASYWKLIPLCSNLVIVYSFLWTRLNSYRSVVSGTLSLHSKRHINKPIIIGATKCDPHRLRVYYELAQSTFEVSDTLMLNKSPAISNKTPPSGCEYPSPLLVCVRVGFSTPRRKNIIFSHVLADVHACSSLVDVLIVDIVNFTQRNVVVKRHIIKDVFLIDMTMCIHCFVQNIADLKHNAEVGANDMCAVSYCLEQ